jgi:diadenosine tetraphosphate (Ap4A) HIT family hydrolase
VTATADCLICREHRGEVELPGGPLVADDLVVAFHVLPLEQERSYLGHLLVTPRRHAPGLDDLTDDEAAAIGVASARLARALRAVLDLERVYSAVIGHHVPHLHVHLFPRYRGTPDDLEWFRVDEWEDAPRGGPSEIAETVDRLRRALA